MLLTRASFENSAVLAVWRCRCWTARDKWHIDQWLMELIKQFNSIHFNGEAMLDRLKLEQGQTVRLVSSREIGFMGETDVTDYEILDADGKVVGTVELREHIAVRGFQKTNTVVQRDADGRTVVSESWNP